MLGSILPKVQQFSDPGQARKPEMFSGAATADSPTEPGPEPLTDPRLTQHRVSVGFRSCAKLVTMSSYIPRLNASTFQCPLCKAITGQTWKILYSTSIGNAWSQATQNLNEIRDRDRDFDDEYDEDDEPDKKRWTSSECNACLHHTLWIGESLVYPNVQQTSNLEPPHPDMPPGVADLYQEAAAVLPYSKRAAAALSRAAAERLVKELTPDMPEKIQLNGRLAALQDRVSRPTQKALQAIRHVGNKSLHGDNGQDGAVILYLDGDSNEVAELFFFAINDLVEQCITRPRKIDDLYDALPKSVREGIERTAKTNMQLQSGATTT